MDKKIIKSFLISLKVDLVHHQVSKLHVSTKMGCGAFWTFFVCWEGVAIQARGPVEGVLILWDNWWL